MSKTSRVARQQAQRAAAAALKRERERKQRFAWAAGAVAVVLVVVVVLVAVKLAGGGSSEPQQGTTEASADLISAVTGVPATTLDQVGAGKVDSLPTAITGQPALTADGKPLVVYLGAEYCPFCAAQRWGMVVALSRFGTFTGLKASHSGSADVYPNTATLSFHGSTYTSQYLSFQGVELQSNVKQGSTYATLDTPTAQQQQILTTYNAPPYVPADSAGSIPFIDFGNKYLISGASISPELLAGKSADEIGKLLSNPGDPIAQAIDGAANAFTATICQLTGAQPAAVCSSAAVSAYAGKIK